MLKQAALIIFLSIEFYGQSQNIDSLKSLLKTDFHDTDRCNILVQLVEAESDEKIWPVYNEELKSRCESFLNSSSGTNPLRKFYLRRLADALNNTGFLAYSRGDIPNSIKYFSESLKIQEEIGDKKGLATSLNNLGSIYDNHGNTKLAIEHFNRSLEIKKEIGDMAGVAGTLNNLATSYKNHGNIDRAIEYMKKALQIEEQIGNKEGIARELNNLGVIYQDQNNPVSMEFYNRSLSIQEEIGDKKGIAFTLCNLATVQIRKKSWNGARQYAERSLKISKQLGYPENIKQSSSALAIIYSHINQWQKAYEMEVLFKQMNDSLRNESNRKASIQKALQYEYEKKAEADRIRIEGEKKVFDARIKQERVLRFALYGGLILVAGFSIFLFNRFRITQRQKAIIEKQKQSVDEAYEKLDEKNQEVMDSIHYAKRIQTALLTSEVYIEKMLAKLHSNKS
jgi:tetratricopeptide (TPR) repeat protein